MFKGVDVSRPWPHTGMTTEKWKQVPPFWIPISELIATQEGVKLAPLSDIKKSLRYVSHSGDFHPHVVSWRGNLYLEDGHHRAVSAAISGNTQIFARVLTIVDHGE